MNTIYIQLIYFIYGLVFFLLGFAISIQKTQNSKLLLSNCLIWLSFFGYLHGIAEWLYLVKLVNGDYLTPGSLELLHKIQVAFWSMSFVFLFLFGLDLIVRTINKYKILKLLPLVILTGWFVFEGSELSARYFLGAPAALISAAGLKLQSNELTKLNSKRLLRFLQNKKNGYCC